MGTEAPGKMNPDEEKPFRFMDMPREMRDEVYENLLIDYPRVETADGGDFVLGVQQGPSRAMLLVGRQFSKEYTDTVKRTAKFVIVDSYTGIPKRVCPERDTHIKVTQAELKIILDCHLCKKGLQHDFTRKRPCLDTWVNRHCIWLERMKDDFPQLLTSKLSVCLLNLPQTPKWPEGLPALPDLSDQLKTLTSAAIPGLQQITVFWGKENSRTRFSPDWHELEVVGQYSKWTKEGGWSAA